MIIKLEELKKYIINFNEKDLFIEKDLSLTTRNELDETILKRITINNAAVGDYRLVNVKLKKEEEGDYYNYIQLYKKEELIGFLDIIGLYMIFNNTTREDAVYKLAKMYNIQSQDTTYYDEQVDIFNNNAEFIDYLTEHMFDYPSLYRLMKKEIDFYKLLNEVGKVKITNSNETHKDLQVLKISSRWLEEWIVIKDIDINIKKSTIADTFNLLSLLGLIEKVKYFDIPIHLLEREKRKNQANYNLTTFYIIPKLDKQLLKDANEVAKLLISKKITRSNITSRRLEEKLSTEYYNRVYFNTKEKIKAIEWVKENNKNAKKVQKTITEMIQEEFFKSINKELPF